MDTKCLLRKIGLPKLCSVQSSEMLCTLCCAVFSSVCSIVCSDADNELEIILEILER